MVHFKIIDQETNLINYKTSKYYECLKTLKYLGCSLKSYQKKIVKYYLYLYPPTKYALSYIVTLEVENISNSIHKEY